MMEKVEVENSVSRKASSTAKNPSVCKEVMVAFSRAFKNHAIYPPDHVIRRNAVTEFEKRLSEVISKKDRFQVDVENDRLLHEGQVIYQSILQKGDIPNILFRDGIQWIAFESGIEGYEILRFLEILHRNRFVKEEAEGDIVTALWDAGLPHLHYEAVDVLWEAEPPAGVEKGRPGEYRASGVLKEPDAVPIPASEMPVQLEPLQDEENFAKTNQKAAPPEPIHSLADCPDTQEEVMSIAAPEIDRDLWRLTEAERNQLHEMVVQEENWNSIDDVLDVLVVILQEQQTKEDFSTILEFLVEEFRMTLEQLEFQLAADLLDKLHRMKNGYPEPDHWAPPLLDQFFHTISGTKVLNAFDECRSEPASLSDDQLKTVRRLLLQLHPRAVYPLGLMLPGTSDPRLRKLFVEIIGSLADIDPVRLEKLLEHPDDQLVRQMVFILGHLKHPDAVPLLARMLSHPSDSIRKQAMKAIISRGSGTLSKLFPLIEDPSPEIRRKILGLLARRRSSQAESLLLEYLSEGRFQIDEPLHVIACYHALGRCGSFQSIPFLRAVLLEKGWRSIIGLEKPYERQGAAMALLELKMEMAEEILQKAARSRFTSIRKAYERAFEAVR